MSARVTLFVCLGLALLMPTASRASDPSDLLLLRFDGTLNGESGEVPTQAAGYAFQAGLQNQAVALPVGAQLLYSSANNIDALEGTFECWFKPSWNGNDGQGHTLLQFGQGGGMLIVKDGASNMRLILNRFGVFPGGEVGVGFNVSSWTAGQWHYLAFTWSNSAKKLRAYADGVLQAEQSFLATLPPIGSATLQIGADGAGTYAQGLVDNLRIGNVARSALELTMHLLEGLTISSWALNAPADPVELWPTWHWWITPTLTAHTNAGTLTLPMLAASWTSSNPAVAILEGSSGRVLALAPGTAVLTGTLGTQQHGLTVDVAAPVLPPVEEPIEPFLATPSGSYLYKVPVLVIRYFPTTNGVTLDPALCGSSAPLPAMKAKAERVERQHKFMLEEGSRFRGYGNALTPPALGYQVVKIITVYEDIPPGFPADAGAGIYFPDYNTILPRFDAESLVEQLGVKEIWLWHYHFGRIAPNESNMSSPTTGDVSNSYRTAADQPVYDRTYVTYGLNFDRDVNEATHNHGHQLEAILGYVNLAQDGNDALLWQKFAGHAPNGQWQQGRCGDTHHPPNAVADYDYENTTKVLSDIEDWTPANTGQKKLVNAQTWGGIPYAWPNADPAPGKTEAQWYIYWMQAMPARGSAIPYGANRMSNWWSFTGDWDAAIQAGLGLYEPGSCAFSISPAVQSMSACPGGGSASVTCGGSCKWIASSNEPWISITGAHFGAGNGTVTFSIAGNEGSARTGTIAIAGQVFTVNQGAANPPGEVGSLSLAGGPITQISWPAVAGAESYDVSRGALNALANGSYGACFHDDLPATSTTDTSTPPMGSGWLYLVRGVDAASCAAGSYGTDGDGNERMNLDPAACP